MMMESPCVSILIANYNNGRFIAESLRSAMEQTYQNIEIVVVDDGSDDHSIVVIEEVIKTHPNSRIKLFKNADHRGCGRIKRQCVEFSEGAYFCFLDPDDTLKPEAIATLMEAFPDDPQCGLVYSTHYLCDEELVVQGVSDYPGPIPAGQSHLTSTAGHVSALALCRRQVYEMTSGIDASYQVAEDQDLYLKMEEKASVRYVDKPLYYYRRHDHNQSWNEANAFNNFYWRYLCEKAAYQRRKKQHLTVDNLSKREMDSLSFSFYVRQGKEYRRRGRVFSSCAAYLKAFQYFYTQFCS